jgi:hypothetical protein
MKKILKTLSGLFFFCFVVFSCSKDNSPTVSVDPGKMSSTIDSSTSNFAIRTVSKTVAKDTVSIELVGYNSDSSQTIIISFYKVVGFKPQKFECGEDLYSHTKISVTYLTKGDTYECDGIYGNGSITVLSYNSEAITGSFDLIAGKHYDTTKVVKLKGEFNALYDINSLIPDIDVPQGKMQAQVNSTMKYFDVIAAKVSFNGVDSIINVTGTSGNESIVLQFINLSPTTGQVFNLNRESNTAYAYIKGSYVLDSASTFVTTGLDSATYARFTIVKISNTYIQGKFEFICRKTVEPFTKANITEGKFNSKINNAYAK